MRLLETMIVYHTFLGIIIAVACVTACVVKSLGVGSVGATPL